MGPDVEIPRRAVVRLVRFGFEDGERAARLLSHPDLGLWDLGRNEPADPEAGPVVAALARAGDPDLAVRSLHRLVEALDDADATGEAAAGCSPACAGRRCCGAACSPSSARAPGWPTTSPRTPMTGPSSTPRTPARPGRLRWPWSGRCSPPSAPTRTTRRGASGLGKGAPDASPARVAGLRLAYRRAILSLAGRDLGDNLPAEDAAAELADIAAAVLTAGMALAVAEQPADAARRAGWR